MKREKLRMLDLKRCGNMVFRAIKDRCRNVPSTIATITTATKVERLALCDLCVFDVYQLHGADRCKLVPIKRSGHRGRFNAVPKKPDAENFNG